MQSQPKFQTKSISNFLKSDAQIPLEEQLGMSQDIFEKRRLKRHILQHIVKSQNLKQLQSDSRGDEVMKKIEIKETD